MPERMKYFTLMQRAGGLNLQGTKLGLAVLSAILPAAVLLKHPHAQVGDRRADERV